MLEEEKRVSSRVSNGIVSFDTQRVVDRLREGGWNEGQARALCDVLRELMRGVAMSVELERVESSLRADNKRLESSLEMKIGSLEGQMNSLRADNKRLEASVEAKFASMEVQMDSLRADNKRLEASMDGKFASMDGKFASMEVKFASMDVKFASLEEKMEVKFASVEGQIASLRFMMLAGFGFLGVLMTFVGIFF